MAHTVQDILSALETLAPLRYQESYDNAGLIVGDRKQKISKALLTLDCTEEVLDEAIQCGAQLIIAHHPILFSGLKSLTGKNYVERVLLKAIRHQIAIYAAHTNLDNMYHGVNRHIARRLGLTDCRVLEPMRNILTHLYVYVPETHLDKLRTALFEAGAGQIGQYSECSFSFPGEGTYRPSENAKPYIGSKNKLQKEPEIKLEVLVPAHAEQSVLRAMRENHPYEEIAYGMVSLKNAHQEIGAGMIGQLPKPMKSDSFLKKLKKTMQTSCIRHTAPVKKEISRVALCGGSGHFLLPAAICEKADIFITADVKYHQFFDAENHLILADIGHFESEQFTPEIFYEVLSKKIPNFAFHLSSVNTNPIHYL